MPDIGHAGHLREGYRRDIGTGHAERAGRIRNVLLVHFQHARRDLLRLCDNALGGHVHAGSADRHRTGIEGTVAGLYLARVTLYDVNVFNRNLQHVGSDLRQRRDMALSLAHRARIDCGSSAGVDADPRAFPAAPVESAHSQPA